MKRICAWCGKSLNEVESPDAPQITHGLCEGCRKSVFASKSSNEANDLATKGPTRDLKVSADAAPFE